MSRKKGKRIRVTAMHEMQEKGIVIRAAEAGDHFYIDWHPGGIIRRRERVTGSG